ncbi:MAG: amidase family protein, partial [Acidobacteriaceae bacterium]
MNADAQQPLPSAEPLDATRRRFLAVSTAAGLGSTLFPGALLALATNSSAAQTPVQSDLRGWPAITPEMLEAAAAIAAIKLTPDQIKTMLDGVLGDRNSALRVRELHLPNSVAPTAVFNPVPAGTPGPQPAPPQPVVLGPAPSVAGISASEEEKVAFATIRQLGELMRRHKLTSVELTKLYLARLKRYDPTLHFVINYTEDRALAQAAAADRELAHGHPRSPLHGIPWGAKDLLAVKGYPTTWGAAGFEHQTFDEDAEVVKRLDAAGAVLIAKLTMGALAQGDLWG